MEEPTRPCRQEPTRAVVVVQAEEERPEGEAEEGRRRGAVGIGADKQARHAAAADASSVMAFLFLPEEGRATHLCLLADAQVGLHQAVADRLLDGVFHRRARLERLALHSAGA